VSRDGLVYYVVRRGLDDKEFIEHVGIIGRGHSPVFSDDYTIPVYDWPIDSRGGGRRNSDLTRNFSTTEYDRSGTLVGLCFAWPENGIQSLRNISLKDIYNTASGIIETVLRGFSENELVSIHSILYMLDPPIDPDFRPSKTIPLMRYFRGSCVGFVEHCFECAGLSLVDLKKLPILQSRDDLAQLAIGDYFLLLDKKAVRKNSQHRLFERDFPLRILFPGYLCSAMTDDKAYPFSPSLEHAEGC